MTVRQAMDSLENDGLIRRVPGSGTFVQSDARQHLKHGQDIFALVVPDTRHGFYPSLLSAFGTAASDVHHQTLVCCTDADAERQAAIVLQLIDKKVGGVAINPLGIHAAPTYQIRQLKEHGIPVVFLHRRVEGIEAPVLTIANRDVGRLAGKVLAEQGHRRVAFFTVGPNPVTATHEKGFEEGLRAGGCDIRPQILYVAESMVVVQESALMATLQAVMCGPNPPTAIHTSFDSMAEMLYLLLPQLGLRVPQDVSLLGFGGAWRGDAICQRLTSVVVDEEATGRQAVAWLYEMRCGKRPIDDNTEVVMELNISKGETLAMPAESIQRAS